MSFELGARGLPFELADENLALDLLLGGRSMDEKSDALGLLCAGSSPPVRIPPCMFSSGAKGAERGSISDMNAVTRAP